MKRIRILLIALVLVLGGVFFNNSYAAVRHISAYTEGEAPNFEFVRPYTHSKYQYRVPVNIMYTLVKLYDSDIQDDELLFQKAIYCLRGGVGFGDDDISQTQVNYNEIGEMHTNAKTVVDKYKALYGIDLDREEDITFGTTSKTVNIYTALLWVIDESYLPEDKVKEIDGEDVVVYSEEEYKQELLSKAGIPLSQQDDITKDDIEVIQQLAMWFFANYDEQQAGTTPTVSQGVRWPSQFLWINGSNNIRNDSEDGGSRYRRAENLNRLYQYLVEGALENANDITYTITRDSSEKIVSLTKKVEENKFDQSQELLIESVNVNPLYNYYKIGPIQIEGSAGDRKTVNASDIVLYDAEGTIVPRYYEILEEEETPYGDGDVTFGGYNVVYRFVNEDGEEVTSLIKGVNYYIRFYKVFEKGSSVIPVEEQFDMSTVTLRIGSSYTQTTANFLTTNNSTDQALVEIEKEKVYSEDELNTKKFDLSLRKFITKITREVNGQTVEVSFDKDGRKPTIDTNTLVDGYLDERTGQTQYTATYDHDKDPIEIKHGDRVIYTIRVYNEGGKNGTATVVADYLPTGLQLVDPAQSTINATNGWQVDQTHSTQNHVKITTDHLAGITIKAFDPDKDTPEAGWQPADEGPGGLYYADLQVECIVTANPGDSAKALKNIAEIVNDTADDVDSDTDNVNSEDYDYEEDNSIIEQDDDDWENLVLKEVEFDLSLRKFISKVERIDKTTGDLEEINITSRVPQLYTKDLDEDDDVDTARYVHPKETVSLKRGDIITYTIRIYNEGKEIDGYATLVTDYLPEGLELVEGENNIWDVNGNVLTTDELADDVIPAYGSNSTECSKQDAVDNGPALYYRDLTIVCKIKDTVDDGARLVNIAEISEDLAQPTDIDDRDSTPGDFPDDKKNNNYDGNGEDDGYFPGQYDDDDFEPITVEPREVFDLALRKYIVALEDSEGTAKTISNKRTNAQGNIEINDDVLNQGRRTAEYKHRKDPVVVEPGDVVTYRFSVYNEGDIDGYVYSIKDYVPAEYLAFDVQGNENFIEEKDEYAQGETDGKEYTYKIEGNKITIKKLNQDEMFELEAYDGQDLDTDYIDVKFKVIASVTNEDQVLTNVATMTYAAKDSETRDRDSNITGEEFTVPTQNQLVSNDELEYTGGRDEEDLAKTNYHYIGQQDDDDFEKVVIKAKAFDLALRKIIVGLKDSEGTIKSIPNRDGITPNPNPLKQGQDTADYYHQKDAVEVEVGDYVTYRLTTYNEGDIKGYVYSIKDYVPKYLQFVPTQDFVSAEEVEAYWNLAGVSELTNEQIALKTKVEAAKYYYYFEKFVSIPEFPQVEYDNQILVITNLRDVINPTNGTEESILWSLDPYDGGADLDSKYVDVTFKVTDNAVFANDTYLTNVATMTYGSDTNKIKTENVQPDRDSNRAGDWHIGEEFTIPTEDELVSENEKEYTGGRGENDLTKTDYHYIGQQDDDDFEKVVVRGKYFDLALRKFITSVRRNGNEVDFGKEERAPKIDLSTLINGNYVRNGEEEPTATYEHEKDPVIVKTGDIVTYTIRIYNEGQRDGYATEITDYIPEGLALIDKYETNYDNGWSFDGSSLMDLVGEDGFYKTEQEASKNFNVEDFKGGVTSLKDVKLVKGKATIKSSILSNEKISAFDPDKKSDPNPTANGWQPAKDGQGGLYYKDIQVSCLVIADNTKEKGVLTNFAEISEDADENKQPVDDIDSQPNNINQKNQDDDDYEPVILKYFDLALRKFITGVITNGEMEEIKTRYPNISINEETGNLQYKHPKEEDPVRVGNNDIVVYTIRVYNEGTVAGYAEEITDDIPDGLEFLPENDINKEYEWVMFNENGEETDDVEKAVKVTTDYLSSYKEKKSKLVVIDEETGEATGGKNVRNNQIKPFDSSSPISATNPDYRDVKIAFKVVEPNTSNRVLKNQAQISDDSDDDEDSRPNEWLPDDDDQDEEFVYVKYFDLSLLKWVTRTIVTVDGKTTTTTTGFKPNTGKTETTGIRSNSEKEPIAKVELDRKKLDKTTVKFAYSIKVTNEGEIEGYATEITDYIPEGLKFVESDNTAFGWKQDGEGKVTTRALETVLLKPGESAEVEIIYTWINSTDNFGQKTNIAAITQDYNKYKADDIDSKPGDITKPYEQEQEDDDDFALVLLSIRTGGEANYVVLAVSILTVLASGVYLIKKYVLIY